MTAHLDLQKPLTFGSRLIEPKNGAEKPFTTLDIDTPGLRVVIYLTSRAEADALVKAALAARDLLPGPEPEADPCGCCLCVCPRLAEIEGKCAACREGEHARGAWERTSDPAPLPGEHGENHTYNVPHCPICGTPLDGHGEHVTRSGAHIPPAGLDAGCEPAVTA